MTVEHTRRTVLGSITTTTAGLAGCLGGSWTNEESQSTSSFEDVYVDGESLVVQLSEDATLDRVNVIAPDGEQFASKQVAAGATQVRIPLGVEYTPGDHRIVGVTDDAQVAETTLAITPDVQITMVGVGANHTEKMPDSLGTTQGVEAIVEVSNDGNGPTAITKLLLLGELPNPTNGLHDSSDSGIFNESKGGGSLDRVTLDPGQTRTLFSNTLPFSFEGEGEDCAGEKKTGSFRVVTETTHHRAQAAYRIRYSAAEAYNGCTITISPT